MLCSAYPSSYGDYGGYGGSKRLHFVAYINCYFCTTLPMVGFEPAYAPHFGSGYDTYIYGSYFGHPVYNIGPSLSFTIILNAQFNGTYKVLIY